MALSSTIAYCENQDVFDVYPQIDKFDLKRTLLHGVKTGNLYYYHNSGKVTRLFKNGEDLGAMEEDLQQTNRPDEWFYNTSSDILIINEGSVLGGTDPNLDLIEAGDVWEDIIERFREKASRRIESELGKSISREILKDREGNYPTSIIHITALKTAILLIMAHDPNHPNLISLKAEYDDIIGKILSGRIIMTGHRSENDSKGTIRFVASPIGEGDLRPIELKGNYSGIDYELLKIIIEGGESGVIGTSKMTVYGKSSTTLKSETLIDSEIITGDFQALGVNDLYIRWGGDDDSARTKSLEEYEIELWGSGLHPTISQIKSTTLSRGTLWL